MIVSENTEAAASAFQPVLEASVGILKKEAAKDAQRYLSSSGTKLENLVLDALKTAAEGTEFSGTIRLASGQKFPDIVLDAGGVGVEVKSTTQNHWITTGNSVLESTRAPNIEKIFLMFGKLADPIDFKARPYEDCLKEVLVTHYPRYQIDMDLPRGETIFDKIGKSYDEIRNLPEPVTPIIDYYKEKLQPGQSLWWMGNRNLQEQSSPVTIRELSSITIHERVDIIATSLVLFPQLFGRRQQKFHNVLMWLLRKGFICGNIRDFYTAGGRWNYNVGSSVFSGLPKIVHCLYENRDLVWQKLVTIDALELHEMWNVEVSPNTDRLSRWFSLVSEEVQDVNVMSAIRKMFNKL